MHKFWIVTLETYKRNVKNKTFLMMLFAPVIFLLIIGLGIWASTLFEQKTTIGFIQPEFSELISQDDPALKTLPFQVQFFNTESEAKQELQDQEIDGYIHLTYQNQQLLADYYSSQSLALTNQLALTQLLQNIKLTLIFQELDVSKHLQHTLQETPQIKEHIIDEQTQSEQSEQRQAQVMVNMAGSMFISFVMFIIILMYAKIIAQEVASEKGTRIMEVILSSMPASQHFYGKVMGIFLVIITQMSVYILFGIALFFSLRHKIPVQGTIYITPVKEALVQLLGYPLLFLILGVIIYSISAALSGSLVSKSEDAAKAVIPVTYLAMIGYFLNIFLGVNQPKNPLFVVSSYIPFVSSFTMPVRLAQQTANPYEAIIALVILLLSTYILLIISARVYQVTALIYSDQGVWPVMKRAVFLLRRERTLTQKQEDSNH